MRMATRLTGNRQRAESPPLFFRVEVAMFHALHITTIGLVFVFLSAIVIGVL